MNALPIHPTSYDGSKAYTQLNVHNANATGFGAAADDYMERGIDLNEELIRNKPATFLMRMNGNAMVDLGIHHNDIVLVDRSITPCNGKIIIAVIDGEMLIRKLEKTASKIRLLPGTPKLSPIEVDLAYEAFSIWGTVSYVIHAI
jgi:DNA polymerase V